MNVETQQATRYTMPTCQLYLGDCLEVMKTMGDETVNLIVTSPPYNVGLNYATYQDKLPDEQFQAFNKAWLAEAFRVLADTGRLYVVVSDKMVFTIRPLAEELGFRYVQLLTWCKPNLASAGRVSGDWNYTAEYILLFRKGKSTPMLSGAGVNTHCYFVIASPQSNWNEEAKQHPAQFPIELPSRLIARTPGETVLDPFMGSGSTALAALKLNRRFIGIEIDPTYYAIAERRITAAQQQLPLFQ